MPQRPKQDAESTSLGATVVSRLRLAKSIYEHAAQHSIGSGRKDRLIAIHGFHLASDIVLHMIVDQLPPLTGQAGTQKANKGEDTSFPGLLRRAQSGGGSAMPGGPLWRELEELNRSRNLAQHGGRTPDEAAVAEFRVIVLAFLRDVYRQHFLVEFDSLSDVDLIQDASARRLLKKAESLQQHLAERKTPVQGKEGDVYREHPSDFPDYQTCLALLAVTFELAFDTVSHSVYFYDFQQLLRVPPALEDLGPPESDADPSQAFAVLWTRLRDLEVSNLLAHVGVEYHQYHELVEHAPSLVLLKSKRVLIEPRNWAEPDPDQLSRLIRFVTETILHWEEGAWLKDGMLHPGQTNDANVMTAIMVASDKLPRLSETYDFKKGGGPKIVDTKWIATHLR